MPAWFDAYSLTDIEERQELQVEGLSRRGIFWRFWRGRLSWLEMMLGGWFWGGMSKGMVVVV